MNHRLKQLEDLYENIPKEYCKMINSLDPISTVDAVQHGLYEGIRFEQQNPSAKTCINVMNILLRKDFKSIYEINEFLCNNLV